MKDFIGAPRVKLKDFYRMIKAKAKAEAEEHRRARRARYATQNIDDGDDSDSEPKRECIRSKSRLQ